MRREKCRHDLAARDGVDQDKMPEWMEERSQ